MGAERGAVVTCVDCGRDIPTPTTNPFRCPSCREPRELRVVPQPSVLTAEAVGDLLAFGRAEKEQARVDHNRSQYEFYGGFVAALERVLLPVGASPESQVQEE